jgi:hypothetical protein
MAKLTGGDACGRATNNTLAQKQTRMMSAQPAIILAYNNYQRGMKLQHQRGSHSSAFFKGTHQCAHKVNVFEDTSFDQVFVDFKMINQSIPSPWGMPVFEFVEVDQVAQFFLDYNDFQSDTTPDFTGQRVQAYLKLKDISRRVQLKNAFVPSTTNVDYFAQCPATFDKEKLKRFVNRFESKPAGALIEKLKQFQVRTVRQWNPKINDPSLSIYLGLLGIDEAASKECGSITLDLLLRSGILEETEDGGWTLVNDWDTRRVYLFGDAKTIENMSKFVRDMQDRKISYTQANVQAEVFLKALSCIVQAPGDWHTGMNMLASIYNLYFHGFLEPIKTLLGWNRINKDVRSCYYQAARLVKFVSEELNRFFMQDFVSSRGDHDEGIDDPQYLCNTAVAYMEYQNNQRQSEDKWVSTCANFVQMAYDFFEFVEAYRIGDSITVEYGYQKQVPVWLLLGQNKYVDIFYSQQEVLYRDNVFSRLQELRMNRFVRRYHSDTGKRCVAHDEFLEHGNRFFSEFPMPKSLVSFAFQSNYVGVGLMSKRFSDLWFSTSFKGDVKRDYNDNIGSKMTPERQLVFQMFSLLDTHLVDAKRNSFHLDYVLTIKDRLSVDLTRETLERSMKEAPSTSADGILSTLNQVFGKQIRLAGIDAIGDGELNPDELPTIAEEDESREEEADLENNTSRERDTLTKRKMNDHIFDDPWEKGRVMFAKKDVMRLRDSAATRRKKKSQIRECIINAINADCETKTSVSVGVEMPGRPCWQRHIRARPCNLKF